MYKHAIAYFEKHLPNAAIELDYTTPFQLLIAVILSAQCTDKRVNMVTPALFKAFPTPEILSTSTFDEVYEYTKSISYPVNKTKYIIETAGMLLSKFGGEIPSSTTEMQKLPGVGRKTAHVIASVLYNEPVLAVDTHVFRVSRRIGLVDNNLTTPLAVEKQLVKNLPTKYISKFTQWMVLHGRYTCTARSPKCNKCGLSQICSYYRRVL